METLQKTSWPTAGIKCQSCAAKATQALLALPGVEDVMVDVAAKRLTLLHTGTHSMATLNAALAQVGGYQLLPQGANPDTAASHAAHAVHTQIAAAAPAPAPKPAMPAQAPAPSLTQRISTFYPLLLIFGFITGATLLVQLGSHHFSGMVWMNHFMAGFFLVFSFFKLLDIRGFADGYQTYDLLARRSRLYAYAYPFIELAFGIAYLTGFNPLITNSLMLAVMTISLVGVVQKLMKRETIRCACLGTIFNLPMTYITVAEDGLMVLMSAAMLIML